MKSSDAQIGPNPLARQQVNKIEAMETRGRNGGSFRVAHVTTVDISLRYLLLNQLEYLQRLGYAVTGVSAPGPHAAALEAAGIPHLPVTMTRRFFTPLQDLRALVRLYGTFKRGRFDLVHTHTPKASLLAQLAARAARVPIVVNTVHGFYFHDKMSKWVRRSFISLEKLAARNADCILLQSREDLATALQEGIGSRDNLFHLGNGVDVGRFDPDRITAEDRKRKTDELGIPPRSRVIGFVGRLVRDKGIIELLEAAAEVKREVQSLVLLLIGPIDEAKSDAVTPEVASELGVADVCKFLGLREDLPELYSVMDVLALPSYREGMPRAPMEASLMKVPCIASNVRGCREVIEHGKNGYLIPPRNSQILARRLVEVLSDPQLAREMGENGRTIGLEEFDEQRVFREVGAHYERLLRHKNLVST